MNNEVKEKFETSIKYLEVLNRSYLFTLSSYNIFKNFNDLLTSKEKDLNKKLINDFPYFFQVVRSSSNLYFLIEVYKFFDTDDRTLSLYKLLKYSETNLKYLTKDNFKKYHKGRIILDELFNQYEEITVKDIRNFKAEIRKNADIINRLREYRHKHLAHDDINKIDITIHKDEIETLLKLIKKVLNFYYSILLFSQSSDRNFNLEPVSEMNRLVNNLKEYDKIYRKNFRKRYKVH